MGETLTAKADTHLLQQLDALDSSAEPLQAWFRLKTSAPSGAEATADHTTSLANSLVERVRQHVGEGAQSLKVLPNLNSFMISARPGFVRELIHQPEIESARSANVAGFGLIKPVKSEPVRISSGRHVSGQRSSRGSARLKKRAE